MCNTGKNIPSVTTSDLRTAPQMFKKELFLMVLTVLFFPTKFSVNKCYCK